jgi:uncharacterized protein YgbK (DUF1537 family)
MDERWLIVADDLTGATDSGVAFARHGWDTETFWDEPPPAPETTVWAYDAATRYLAPRECGDRHRDAVMRWLSPGRSLFKKIDSTLRGQPAAEIAALCVALRQLQRPDWSLCAPANPSMGRTTREGRVYVRGEPLERTTTWQLEHSYASADLADIVAGAGLRPVKLPLDCVRSEPALHQALGVAADQAARYPGTVLICDAESDADLQRLAVAARGSRAPGFFVGTAGLAQAIAANNPDAQECRVRLPPTQRGTLVVVGSLAEVSRAAARRLAERSDVRRVWIKPGDFHGDCDSGLSLFVLNIASSLMRGKNVLAVLEADVENPPTPQPEFARNVAVMLGPALKNMGGLIVTGGETAAALLAECYVDGIRLLDELEPGLALGMTRGEVQVPVVTKPGAFGDEGSLARCLDRMNELRRSE